MKLIITGFLSGILYGLIFLIFEDILGFLAIGTNYTLKQIFVSILVYSTFFGAIGAFFGIFIKNTYPLKPRDKVNRSGLFVFLLSGFGAFYFSFEIFAKSISLPQSMKNLLAGGAGWFFIIALAYAIMIILIRKRAKLNGTDTNPYYWAAGFVSTIFFLPIVKVSSSPSLAEAIKPLHIWLIISLAIFCTGLYILLNSILSRNLESDSKMKLPPIAISPLILLPLIFWIIAYPKSDRIQVINKSLDNEYHPNVIIIMLDALRADHLNIYGYDRNTGHNITTFSKKAAVFSKTYSSTSWTKPSIGTLFTSTYPGVHGANGWSEKLPKVLPTLAEILNDEGYYTVGISTNPFITEDYNFTQGFDHFKFLFGKGSKQLLIPSDPISKLFFEMNEFALWAEFIDSEVAYGSAKSLNDITFSYLDEIGDGPFFLYLHYMDPHQPYIPAEKHFSSGNYFSRKEGRLLRSTHHPEARVRIGEDVIDKVISRYDDEIRYVDKKLGELFTELERGWYFENSIVIICSDHGEELLERGAGGHGHSMYQEQLHVPLIIKFPEIKYEGRNLQQQVGLIDVVPTILDYINVQSGIKFDGKSLMPLLDGTAIQEDDCEELYFGEVHPFKEGWPTDIYTIIREDQKYIWSLKSNDLDFDRRELYNLRADPSELINMAETSWGTSPNLQEMLNSHIQRCDSINLSLGELEDAELSEEQIERLRALGYIK